MCVSSGWVLCSAGNSRDRTGHQEPSCQVKIEEKRHQVQPLGLHRSPLTSFCRILSRPLQKYIHCCISNLLQRLKTKPHDASSSFTGHLASDVSDVLFFLFGAPEGWECSLHETPGGAISPPAPPAGGAGHGPGPISPPAPPESAARCGPGQTSRPAPPGGAAGRGPGPISSPAPPGGAAGRAPPPGAAAAHAAHAPLPALPAAPVASPRRTAAAFVTAPAPCKTAEKNPLLP